MRKAFVGFATLLLLVVVAQFFFAAVGALSTAPRDEAYRPHHALGYVIFLLPVVMTIVAALARMPGRLIWMPALVAGLTAVQVLIVELAKALDSTAGPLVFGLHAVNGLAILALSGLMLRPAVTLHTPSPASSALAPAAEIADPARAIRGKPG